MTIRFSTYDCCPACHKLCHDMLKEQGKILTMKDGVSVACHRCGNIFLPQSQVKHLIDRVESKIISPYDMGVINNE